MGRRSAKDRWGEAGEAAPPPAEHVETPEAGTAPVVVNGSAKSLIRSFVDRGLNLEAEKKSVADEIRDLMAEVKSSGLDPKVIRRLIKEAGETESQAAARREFEIILDMYRASLRELADSPLGRAAQPEA